MAMASVVGFSAVFATAEGIKQSQAKSRREEHRSRKNNLIVHCVKSSQYSYLLEGKRVVLGGDKLYIDTGNNWQGQFGHPFEGYYLPYPEAKHPGLVSTITHVAPIMNWIYVDKNSWEIKFGKRDATEGNLTGPWDCTRQDRRMTFQGWEGFVAVQEGELWALYFDMDDNLLKDKIAEGVPVLEVELYRRELRTRKPQFVVPPQPQGDQKGGQDAQAQAAQAQAAQAQAAQGQEAQGQNAQAQNTQGQDGQMQDGQAQTNQGQNAQAQNAQAQSAQGASTETKAADAAGETVIRTEEDSWSEATMVPLPESPEVD